jgi:hypothetical protein
MRSRVILDLWIWEDVWNISMEFEGRILWRKFEERLPEDPGAEAILAIH